jgi:bacterial/archaeal transporter family-2 protein
MILIYFLISISAGITIVLARIINSKLAEKIGSLQGIVINYILGLLFSILFYIFSKEKSIFSYHGDSIPFLAYLGGLVGVLVILGSNYITPRISAFYLALLLFIGQLFIGVIIDYLSYQELSIGKILGGFLVMLGLSYNLWIDKKKEVSKLR